VVLLSSNDEAECEMFAWKVCRMMPARDYCRRLQFSDARAPATTGWHQGS